MVFYAVAATVFHCGYLFQPHKLLALIGLLIAGFAAVMFGALPSPTSLAWKSLGLNLAFMFWGSLFHAVYCGPATSSSQQGNHRRLLVLAAAIVLAPSLYAALRFLSSGSADDLRWAIAYPSALLIFSALYFVNSDWMRVASCLGLISYSLYLLHPATSTAVDWLIENHRFMHTIAYLPLLTLAAIGLAVGMSWISYAWLEEPFISLGRKLIARPIDLRALAP